MLVFLSGEGRGAGDVVCLEVGQVVSLDEMARLWRERNSREKALLACRQWQCWDHCSRGRCLARCFWTLRRRRRPDHRDRPGLRGHHLVQTWDAMGEAMRDVPRYSELVLALFGLAWFAQVSCHSDAVDDSFFWRGRQIKSTALGFGVRARAPAVARAPLSSPTQRWSTLELPRTAPCRSSISSQRRPTDPSSSPTLPLFPSPICSSLDQIQPQNTHKTPSSH